MAVISLPRRPRRAVHLAEVLNAAVKGVRLGDRPEEQVDYRR
jgi:hypothetical protein